MKRASPTEKSTSSVTSSAATGISSELLTKSIESRMSMFLQCSSHASGRNFENTLYPRIAGIPKITVSAMQIASDFSRDIRSCWLTVWMLVSSSEIALVAAAKSTRTKKRIPKNLPPGKFAKTCGIVMKTSPGPAFSAACSPPKATTAGMIISPLKNAIAVSKNST